MQIVQQKTPRQITSVVCRLGAMCNLLVWPVVQSARAQLVAQLAVRHEVVHQFAVLLNRWMVIGHEVQPRAYNEDRC